MRRMFQVSQDTTQLLTWVHYLSFDFWPFPQSNLIFLTLNIKQPISILLFCLILLIFWIIIEDIFSWWQGWDILRWRIRGGCILDRVHPKIRRNQRRFKHLWTSSFSWYHGSHDRSQYRHESRRWKLVYHAFIYFNFLT